MRDNILILFLLMGIAGVINVTGNTITFSNTGIYSINSNIAAANNTLTSTTGGTGILQTIDGLTVSSQNSSFFCNNTIHGGNIGIQVDNWSDYIKLTNISGSNIGIKLMDNVGPTAAILDWSSIKNCNYQGILLNPSNTSSIAKLTVDPNTTVELNNATETADYSGQIEIDDGGMVRIVSGRNNIVRRIGNPNPKDDNFIYHPGTSTLPIGYNNNSGDDIINNNYWADNGLGSTTPPFNAFTPALTSTDQSQAPHFRNITYSDASLESGHSGYYTFENVYCGSGISTKTIHRGGSPLVLAAGNDTTYDHCARLAKSADSLEFQTTNYQQAYDAYKIYIESCAYLSNSWTSFSDLGSLDTYRSTDVHRFEEYREWLKTVLYLNLDTNYYCADVNEILHTFGWFNDQRGRDLRGNLAVMYFLVQTNKCPKATAYMDTLNIPATWKALYQAWLDSAQHPNLTPFDSTLPSLEDLGLGILRGKPADVKKFIDATHGEIVSDIMALENPFTTETKLDFSCREAVAIRFEVFDLLGKKVYDGGNRVYDQGPNQIVLPGAGLPHGELFARFSASDGTVKTIKLQHY